MNGLNISNRIVLFAICSSLEYDIKKFIVNKNDNLNFTDDMIAKSNQRKNTVLEKNTKMILDQLDLGDFITLITNTPYDFGTNNEKSTLLSDFFTKIIPIRNRVMHTKPLELGDRSVLIEVIEKISPSIPWISWNETERVKELLNTDPSQLLDNYINMHPNYESNVYHNLPETEFDDTGYVGRKKEIREIKDLIHNRKNQIITIFGNGGVGKTALTVKILYDLIDDSRDTFDAIIWISLKTRTLSQGEFISIQNSISNISELFNNSQDKVIINDDLTPEENLLLFMDTFRVLLVLDNLETINNEEINTFIKNIPENSKVLITSRHGLGELEYRYKLDGMNIQDASIYFRELAKYYGLDIWKKDNQEIKHLIQHSLYSNPLSIKWFISSIYNGLDEKILLSNKDSLIEFCMSNVYEKLSNDEQQILQLFLLINTEISYAEIDYYLEIEMVKLKSSINKLLSTNMITLKNGNYRLTDIAKDYIEKYHPPSNRFFQTFNKKKKKLKAIIQEIKIKYEQDKNIFSFKYIKIDSRDRNTEIACHYLMKCIECFQSDKMEDAKDYAKKATNIAPNYFESYKILGYILGCKGELYEADNNYIIAKEKCDNAIDKARIYFIHSKFTTIGLSDHEEALSLIEKANELLKDNVTILYEQSRLLTYLGRYDSAEMILDYVKKLQPNMSHHQENIYYSRTADLYKRRSETVDIKDYDQKYHYLNNAYLQIVYIQEPDNKAHVLLSEILKDISYFLYIPKMAQLVKVILLNYDFKLDNINNRDSRKILSSINTLDKKVLQNNNVLDNDSIVFFNKYISTFKAKISCSENLRKGVVKNVPGKFGFIKSNAGKEFYFSISDAPGKIKRGDNVHYEIGQNGRGECAKKITII